MGLILFLLNVSNFLPPRINVFTLFVFLPIHLFIVFLLSLCAFDSNNKEPGFIFNIQMNKTFLMNMSRLIALYAL